MKYGRRSTPRRMNYVDGYLRSVPWFRRRDRWFAEELARHGHVRCAVCDRTGNKREFELHHLDYSHVTKDDLGRWRAEEHHDDLVAAHPRCHEWIHQILDRDWAASAARNRRIANQRVIERLRAKVAAMVTASERNDDE